MQGARELQALTRRHPDLPVVRRSMEDLKILHEELEMMSVCLARLDQEIGVVRSLITRKGLPIHFESNSESVGTLSPSPSSAELPQSQASDDCDEIESELDSRCASALQF